MLALDSELIRPPLQWQLQLQSSQFLQVLPTDLQSKVPLTVSALDRRSSLRHELAVCIRQSLNTLVQGFDGEMSLDETRKLDHEDRRFNTQHWHTKGMKLSKAQQILLYRSKTDIR